MKSVLLDTNVLLDVLAKREPHYTSSARVWSLIETNQIKGFISAISYNNLFYILCKAKNRATARKALILLRDLFNTVPLDEKIVNMAIDSDFKDLEDAIQYFSAIRIQANCIITRNKSDFKKADLPILSPEEFLNIDTKEARKRPR